MAQCSSQENLCDDEIFFGKFSLKEVKKRLLPDNRRQTIMCGTETVRVSNDESVNIIETHSEPDMRSVRDTVTSLDYSNASFASRASMGWDIKSADNSFLKIDEMITDLCISPNKNKKEELVNTLEVVEFILNNAPLHDNENKTVPIVSEKGTDEIVSKVTDSLKNRSEVKNKNVKTTNIANVDTKGLNCTKNWIEESNGNVGTINATNIETKVIDCTKSCKEIINENVQTSNTTNVDGNSHIKIEIFHETPAKTPLSLKKYIQNDKIKGISTPFTEIKQNNVFKTPKNPILKKNQTPSSKKTPSRTNAFQHIASPVASYIKNSLQVPLLKDVHPTKPLPGTSSIPKFIKKTNDDKGKENVLLPSIAYRNAKKTKMIPIPDKEKLPQSPWAKKMASSLPKPVILKHVHREVTTVKKPLVTHQEDSFDYLSLHQADVSVCTEKSAVSK